MLQYLYVSDYDCDGLFICIATTEEIARALIIQDINADGFSTFTKLEETKESFVYLVTDPAENDNPKQDERKYFCRWVRPDVSYASENL